MDEATRVHELLERAGELPGSDLDNPAPILLARGARRQRGRRLTLVASVVVCAAIAITATVALSTRRPDTGSPAVTHSSTVPVATSRISAGDLATGHWSDIPAAPIQGRDAAATVWTGREMVVWGGSVNSFDPEKLFDDGAAYDPATTTWRRLAASPLTARSDATSAWTGHALFVWGGARGAQRLVDGALYDPSTDRWRLLPAAPTGAYRQVQAVWTGRQIVLLIEPAGDRVTTVEAVAYNPTTNEWSRLPDLALGRSEPEVFFTAVAADDRIYLWSAWSLSTPQGTGGVEITGGLAAYTLDTATQRWSPTGLARGSVPGVSQAIWTGQQIIAPATDRWSGVHSGPLQFNLSGRLIDPRTAAVTTIPHGPIDDWRPKYLWTGNALLAFDTGSSNGSSHYPGEAALWNPATNLWAQLPHALLGGGNAVWTGSELIIWGHLYVTSTDQAHSPAAKTAGLRFGT